jgi:hypothetical protein
VKSANVAWAESIEEIFSRSLELIFIAVRDTKENTTIFKVVRTDALSSIGKK